MPATATVAPTCPITAFSMTTSFCGQSLPVADVKVRRVRRVPGVKGMACKTAVNKAVLAERQQQALEYRKAGHSYAQIADRMGCGIASAHGYVTKALAKLNAATRETAEQVRSLELQKLDQLEAQLTQQILAFGAVPSKECHRAMELRLKVIAQRCKLLGLVQPQQVNQVVVQPPPDARLEVILQSPVIQQLAETGVREVEAVVVDVPVQS